MQKFSLLLCLPLMLGGCISVPPPAGETYSASYVGDRDSVSIAEVVVSVPAENNPDQFRNLHVAFSALINAQKVSTGNQYDVEGIIRRSRTRISSEMVGEISDKGVIGIKDLGSLRKILEQNAQSTFDSIFSKWSHADDFEVKIVITSIYFTDGSVGKTEQQFMW